MTITPYILLTYLPKPKQQVELIVKQQTTDDIITGIFSMHNDQVANYNKIARFICKNYIATEIPELLFKFLKKYIAYQEDSFRNQDLKSPQIILTDLYCDCKCYAMFIAGVLNSCNNVYETKFFNIKYAFASYDANPEPTHVFVICNNEIIDPCLNYYDQIKSCSYIYTSNVSNNMAVNKITGFGNEFSHLIPKMGLFDPNETNFSSDQNTSSDYGGGGSSEGIDKSSPFENNTNSEDVDTSGLPDSKDYDKNSSSDNSSSDNTGTNGSHGGSSGNPKMPPPPKTNPFGDILTAPTVNIIKKTATNCTIDVLTPQLITAVSAIIAPVTITIQDANNKTVYTGNGKGVVLTPGNYSIFYSYTNTIFKIITSAKKNINIVVSSTSQTSNQNPIATKKSTKKAGSSGLLILGLGLGAVLLLKK